jgi:hypothetical protein
MVVLAAAGALVLGGAPAFEAQFAAERGIDAATTDAFGLVLVAIAAWMAGCLLWFGRRQAVAGLLASLAGLWVLVGWGAAPILNDASSSRGLMRDVGRIIGPRAELGLVAWKEQTLLMADRPARTFGFSAPLPVQWRAARDWQARAPGRRWLLLEDDALGGCVDLARAVRAGRANRRDWWLVPAGAVRPDCARAP